MQDLIVSGGDSNSSDIAFFTEQHSLSFSFERRGRAEYLLHTLESMSNTALALHELKQSKSSKVEFFFFS